jgi:hypothetical protein
MGFFKSLRRAATAAVEPAGREYSLRKAAEEAAKAAEKRAAGTRYSNSVRYKGHQATTAFRSQNPATGISPQQELKARLVKKNDIRKQANLNSQGMQRRSTGFKAFSEKHNPRPAHPGEAHTNTSSTGSANTGADTSQHGAHSVWRLNKDFKGEGWLGGTFSTVKELGGNMLGSINATGKRNFLKSAAKYGTYGAGIGAGSAVLQGDDPWEGAKSGFMKGFVGGAAVKGFAHATGTVGGGMKGFATGAKRVAATYNMNARGTLNGGAVSKQVKAITRAESAHAINKNVMSQ